MIENDFFATTYEGESIFDAVDAGNYASLKSLIVKGAKIDSLIAEIDKSTDIKNTVWNKFGYGLNFDQDGAIIISLMWGN